MLIFVSYLLLAGICAALGYMYGHASCLRDVQRTLREYDGR